MLFELSAAQLKSNGKMDQLLFVKKGRNAGGTEGRLKFGDAFTAV